MAPLGAADTPLPSAVSVSIALCLGVLLLKAEIKKCFVGSHFKILWLLVFPPFIRPFLQSVCEEFTVFPSFLPTVQTHMPGQVD